MEQRVNRATDLHETAYRVPVSWLCAPALILQVQCVTFEPDSYPTGASGNDPRHAWLAIELTREVEEVLVRNGVPNQRHSSAVQLEMCGRISVGRMTGIDARVRDVVVSPTIIPFEPEVYRHLFPSAILSLFARDQGCSNRDQAHAPPYLTSEKRRGASQRLVLNRCQQVHYSLLASSVFAASAVPSAFFAPGARRLRRVFFTSAPAFSFAE